MGHRRAVVSADANRPLHERRGIWLAQWFGQVARVLSRQPAPGTRRGSGIADRCCLWHGREIPREIPARTLRSRLDLRHLLRHSPRSRRFELSRGKRRVRRGKGAATERRRRSSEGRSDVFRRWWPWYAVGALSSELHPVSYTHLRAHET